MQQNLKLNEILKEKSLNEMTQDMLRQVKNEPGNIALREVLFKLYCIEGLWEKAMLQLETSLLLDDSDKKQIELYKNLVLSEMLREQVLAGKKVAVTLDKLSSPWLEKLQQANKAYHEGDIERSDMLRLDAFNELPENSGNGPQTGSFGWLADSDSRLGPVCEFINAGGYRWVPFTDIQSLSVQTPQDTLELVWAQAQIVMNGETYYGFIPARYPITHETDQAIKLGYRTEWNSLTDVLSVGVGRKVLITDQNEFSLFEIDNIYFA
ncbi:type VI secretion system accessory protein TagJ [Pantoea sp.]|uniref:type VI secretion system accessory protein TagJ n=1 Tax=Pantoea sp. TaxID=69393 RepID=UPI0028977718|nr:type VI secretion system accessory protein TagJ [Pantoea sp.]